LTVASSEDRENFLKQEDACNSGENEQDQQGNRKQTEQLQFEPPLAVKECGCQAKMPRSPLGRYDLIQGKHKDRQDQRHQPVSEPGQMVLNVPCVKGEFDYDERYERVEHGLYNIHSYG